MNANIPCVPTGWVPKLGNQTETVDVSSDTSRRWDSDHAVVFGSRTPTPIQDINETLGSLMKKVSEKETRAHNHYYKDVSKLEFVDVYRVLDLFDVSNACLQHAIKKLLVAGGRGAGKDIDKDIQEAIDSLIRYQEIQIENGK